MPELIERGHLYIAQPPLYKVTRGKSSQYIKNEEAFEDYLIDSGLNDAKLELANGEVRAGGDLRQIIDEARNIRTLIDGLHTRYSHAVVEQAAIAGALNADVLKDPEQAAEAAAYVARRLDLISEETERGWQGRCYPDYDDLGGSMFEMVVS